MADEESEKKSPSESEGSALEVPVEAPKKQRRVPASWGNPLLRVDLFWTRFETALAAIVLFLEVFALTAWVGLKGLSTPADSASASGVVFRAIVGATILGVGAVFVVKKQSIGVQRAVTLTAVLLGFFLARYWRGFGVVYSSNLLNWYQQASTLTLFGGLRGVATRLTLLLALLGASLATARGKHLTIDVVTRFIPSSLKLPAAVTGWLGAGLISAGLSWGFLDHIAIESYGAKAESGPGAKVEKVLEELGGSFFALRKQIALDFKAAPHVLAGEPYADWFKGSEWNAWVKDAGFTERYGAAAVDAMLIDADEVRSPIVSIPGKGEPRGDLVHAANLVAPLGFLIMALRFFLRSLLALSGHVDVEEDSGEFTTDDADARKGAAV